MTLCIMRKCTVPAVVDTQLIPAQYISLQGVPPFITLVISIFYIVCITQQPTITTGWLHAPSDPCRHHHYPPSCDTYRYYDLYHESYKKHRL